MMPKGIILGLIAMLLALPALAETPPPLLTVTGEAVLQVPADQATLRVGVEATGKSAEVALATCGKTLQKIENALRKAGLEEGEYQTGSLQVQPQWSARPRDPAPDWRAQIVGYTASSRFDLTTKKLERLGALIAAASEAGANDIGQIGFTLADPRTYRAAAISTAAANALADAATLAAAAGVELSGIQSINLDHAAVPPSQPLAMAAMSMRALDKEMAVPIVAPGDLEVRASVSVVYRITGK